jgi:hypothetical protein
MPTQLPAPIPVRKTVAAALDLTCHETFDAASWCVDAHENSAGSTRVAQDGVHDDDTARWTLTSCCVLPLFYF